MPETELGKEQLDAVAHVPELAGVELVPPPPPPQDVNPADRSTTMLIDLRYLIFIEMLASGMVNYNN